MGFTGVRPPQEDHIGLLDLLVGAGAAPGPEHCRQTDDAGSVASPVAAIDVVRADDAAGELLCHEVHLVGRLRAAEQAERVRAASGDRVAEPARGSIEGLIPRRGTQDAVLADERLGEPGEWLSHLLHHLLSSCESYPDAGLRLVQTAVLAELGAGVRVR